MSRNIFRLHRPVKRPTLSWSTTPQARESLLALTHWLLGGYKAEVVQIFAAQNSLLTLAGRSGSESAPVPPPLALGAEPKVRQPHLKVVLVHDAQNPQAHSPARLMISGRMADVCAELDRLAA